MSRWPIISRMRSSSDLTLLFSVIADELAVAEDEDVVCDVLALLEPMAYEGD